MPDGYWWEIGPDKRREERDTFDITDIGRFLSRGSQQVFKGLDYWNRTVVQPIAGLMTPQGQERFREKVREGNWTAGFGAAAQAWREEVPLPGWAKFAVETVVDPSNLVPFGRILAPVPVLGRSAARMIKTYDELVGGAFRGAATVTKKLAGPLAKPPIEEIVVGAPSTAMLAELMQIAGPRALSKRVSTTASIVEDILTAPPTTPERQWLAKTVGEKLQDAAADPDALEALKAEWSTMTPRAFIEDMMRRYTGELKKGVPEALEGLPPMDRFLNKLNRLHEGGILGAMERYFASPLSGAYLTFANYIPPNALEAAMNAMQGGAAPGFRSGQEFLRGILGLPLTKEDWKVLRPLTEDAAYFQMPGRRISEAGPGARGMVKTMWEAVKQTWRHPTEFGRTVSNVVTNYMQRDAWWDMYLRNLGEFMNDPAWSKVSALLSEPPTPEWKRYWSRLKPEIRAKILDPELERLAEDWSSSIITRRALKEVRGLHFELPPDAYAVLGQAIDEGLTSQNLREVMDSVREAVLKGEGGLVERTDPDRMLQIVRGLRQKAESLTSTSPEAIPMAHATAVMGDAITQALSAQSRLATRLSAGIRNLDIKADIHKQFEDRAARIVNEVMPEWADLRRLVGAKVVREPRAKLFLGPDIDIQAQAAQRWQQYQGLRRQFGLTTGEKLDAEAWNAFYEAKEELWRDFDDLVQQASRRWRDQQWAVATGERLGPAAAPMEPIDLDSLVQGNMVDRALKHVDEVEAQLREVLGAPPVTDEMQEALRQYLVSVKEQVSGLPDSVRDNLRARQRQAIEETMREYKRNFPVYTDTTIADRLLAHWIPYWRYEAHRLRWIPEAIARYPGLAVAYARYMTGTDEGYLPVPGGFEVSPLRGTILGTLRRVFAREYPPDRRGTLGQLIALNDTLTRLGIFTGPSIQLALAIARSPSEAGIQLGEVLDPTTQSLLNLLQVLPGVGDEIDAFRTSWLGDRFREYYIRKELARRGISPSEATPEQRDAVLRSVAWRELLSTQLGVLRYRPQVEREYRQARVKAYAQALGVPEEQVEEVFRQGKRPESVWAISPAQRTAIRDSLRDYAIWNEVTLPLREPMERQVAQRTQEYWDTLEKLRTVLRSGSPQELEALGLGIRTSQEEDDRLLQEGKITGRDWRERRAQRQAALSTARRVLKASPEYSIVPLSEEERITRYPRLALDKVHPVREVLDKYFAVSPTDYADASGNVDWARFRRAREEALMSLGPQVAAEAREFIQKDFSPVEKLYARASELFQRYTEIPRYRNVSEDDQDAVAEIRRVAQGIRRVDPLTPWALLLLRVARQLGYPARLAVLAQAARPNPARQRFMRAHPILGVFYGDVPLQEAGER